MIKNSFEDLGDGTTKMGFGDGRYVLIDTEDKERLMNLGRSWCINADGYVKFIKHTAGCGEVKYVALHRFLMDCPKGMIIDHCSGDVRDCRKSNLRVCTQKENRRNLHKHSNENGFVGLCKYTSTSIGTYYGARIESDGITTHLGYYATKEDAARAYNIASRDMRKSHYTVNAVEDPFRTPVALDLRADRSTDPAVSIRNMTNRNLLVYIYMNISGKPKQVGIGSFTEEADAEAYRESLTKQNLLDLVKAYLAKGVVDVNGKTYDFSKRKLKISQK